jgi:phosphate starvation-inducible membrane PsiE
MTMIKTSFSSLYPVCFRYIIYLGFTSLMGYILQAIAPKYYIEEAGAGVGLKKVAVV